MTENNYMPEDNNGIRDGVSPSASNEEGLPRDPDENPEAVGAAKDPLPDAEGANPLGTPAADDDEIDIRSDDEDDDQPEKADTDNPPFRKGDAVWRNSFGAETPVRVTGYAGENRLSIESDIEDGETVDINEIVWNPEDFQQKLTDWIESKPDIAEAMSDPTIELAYRSAIDSLSNPRSTPDELISAGRSMNASADELIELLGALGQDQGTLDKIQARSGELPPKQKFEPENDEEEDLFGETQNALKEAKDALNGNDEEEKEKARGKLHNLLYRDGGWGHLSKGQIVNRGLIRPGIAIMIITAIIYLSLLNIATKWAAQKR